MSNVHNTARTTVLRKYADGRRNTTPARFAIPPTRRAMVLVLDELLARDGRTQLAISFASGVDQSYTSRLRLGKQDPTRLVLEALAEGLELNAYDRARLLVSAGFMPIRGDPVFNETVCQLAARRGLTSSAQRDSM